MDSANTLHPLLAKNLPELASQSPHWGQLTGSSLSLAIAELAKKQRGFITLVAPDSHRAEILQEELRFFLAQSEHLLSHLPDWETLPYDLFSPHEDIVSERLKALYRLRQAKKGLLVVPASTLMTRLAPPEWLYGSSIQLNTGDLLDPSEFQRELDAAGYHAVSQVISHGEYATRGSLIDLFPMGSAEPLRIDLFDDEIESIRTFDPETQLSTEKVNQVNLMPAHEFPLDEQGIKNFRQRYRSRFEGDPQKSPIYSSVSNGNPSGGIEYYLPLFFENTATLFDYLPENTLFCHFNDLQDTAEEVYGEVETRYEQRRHDIERPILPPDEIYLSPAELQKKLNHHSRLALQSFSIDTESEHVAGINFSTRAIKDVSFKGRQENPVEALQDFIKARRDERILFTADSAGRREFILEALKPYGIRPKTVPDWHAFSNSQARLSITTAPLDKGAYLEADGLTLIAESQLFPERTRQTRKRRKPTRDADAVVRNLTDLQIGSPVVHEDHGVGRFLGLERLEVGGSEAEYLMLSYAGDDKLYVPVSSLHLISRYTGANEDTAPLHKLGGEQWTKAKRKAAQKAHDVAAELLDIYARRAARKGIAYSIESHEYQAFASAFPFEETEDQTKAIDAVLEDLAASTPTDRVVCGDVGFGKTEVAMRAAFVVANAGKQVAVLVPTTLLAQQHGENFADRFAEWPFRIEALSRFKTPKEQKAILEAAAAGKADILIGTHKLLQKSVKFKDLGLIIIDEEQRFGVRHKEQLKSLRAEVDLLTLTATPIPRTLNMSMAGLRDLSIIATPPRQRHAIKTFVTQWERNLIEEACRREIHRGGQIYFLHNEVKSIEKAARELQEIVPEAKIEIAHGQMRESELEQVMVDFYHQRFNILVCTTIIETGLDVPSANTIIIQRADCFGLSQLHQLRGRVGRSHHKAYAYLITPPPKAMTPDARKRLEAIESLEDLGVGFTLATHDLEIRGAGELLGDGQSGQIQEIGFTLYNDLLERAVKALKSGEIPELTESSHSQTEVNLGEPALLPDDYIPDVHARLILYKRISSAKTEADLRELQVELIDRFGLLTEQTKTLFEATRLKLRASPLGIIKLDVGFASGQLLLSEKPDIDVTRLFSLIQTRPQEYKLQGQDKLKFYHLEDDQEKRIRWVDNLLDQLTPSQ